MKIRVLLAYSISLLGFVASLLKTDIGWLMFIGTPFFVLLCAAIHEGGHCIGCLCKGNKITEVSLPFMRMKEGKLTTTSKLTSYCVFKKSESDVFIYVLGPIFSLLHAAVWFVLYMRFKSMSLFVYLIASALVFIMNMLPIRNNDLQKIIEGLKRRNDS